MGIEAIKDIFFCRGMRLVQEKNPHIYMIENSSHLTKGDASAMIEGAKHCAVFSQNRIKGNLVFTIVPYATSKRFLIQNVESNKMNRDELWRIVNTTLRPFVDSPVMIQGKCVFSSSVEGQKEMFSHCNLPSSYLLEYLESTPMGRALDLGCGKGANTTTLLKKGWEVCAVDCSTELLVELNTRKDAENLSALSVVCANIHEWGFPKNAFDLVVAIDLLPYLDPRQLEAIMGKIHAALLEGGKITGTLFFNETPSLHTELLQQLGAYFFPNKEMIPALLESCGFTVEKCSLRFDDPAFPSACVEFIASKG